MKIKKEVNYWFISSLIACILTSYLSYQSWKNNNGAFSKTYTNRYAGFRYYPYDNNLKEVENSGYNSQVFLLRPVLVFTGVNYLSRDEIDYPILLIWNMFISCVILLGVVFVPLIILKLKS